MSERLDALEIQPRGVPLRLVVNNGRLRIWATRFEEIEPELLDVVDTMSPGTVFYDIGASIGLFSLYAAIRRHARVVAFEAEAQNYATLELNHFLNKDRLPTPLTAFNLALSDAGGLGRIYTRVYGAGEHGKVLDHAISQDTKETFEPAHVQTVLKQSLDDIIELCELPRPGVLKIDVDGAEASVLRGATRALNGPDLHTVFIELSDVSQTNESAILESHGFRLVEKFPVVRLRGGFYPGLFNCLFRR